MDKDLKEAVDIILDSKLTIALTGAGISVESGIPDFRSAQGLWAKFNPEEYATIEAFRANPEKVWQMLKEMEELVQNAKPNPAHVAMAWMEEKGLLHWIITQNIDNLHQEAGSKNVIEYHGNARTLSCIWCGKGFDARDKADEHIPRCVCGKVLKPDVVFFGEPIPSYCLNKSYELAYSCNALLIVGTSAVVSPANTIPNIAKERGAKIIEVNLERTHLTHSITDVFLQGKAGEVMWKLKDELERRIH